jgi:hypothetical protein
MFFNSSNKWRCRLNIRSWLKQYVVCGVVIGSVAMRTRVRARAVTSFCIRCGGRDGIHGAFFARDGFSPMSDICDCVVVSGGEYCWRVALLGFEDFYPVMKWKWRLPRASILPLVAREWNNCDNGVWYLSENKANGSYPGLWRLKKCGL